MTLPDERYRAVLCAKRFLQELATDKEKYPRIPKRVRQEAFSILRHYPSAYEMNLASNLAPDIFSQKSWFEQSLKKDIDNGKEKQTI